MKEVYLCSDYLESHPLFREFGTDLASLAEKDYNGHGYFKGMEIPAIDLDEFERNTKRSNDCTSDAVVGIADVSESRLSNRRLFLTELRLDYENQKNLDFANIKKKYVHSVEILRHYDSDIRIDSKFALVFSNKVEQKAKRWINSWSRESSKKDASNWITYTPESFCNQINYGKELPLNPTADTVSVVESFSTRSKIGYDEFCILANRIIDYWYRIKNRHLVVDKEYMSEKMSLYLSNLDFPGGEEGELCRMLKGDIENLLRL